MGRLGGLDVGSIVGSGYEIVHRNCMIGGEMRLMKCKVLGFDHLINPANVIDMFQMITVGGRAPTKAPTVGIREVGREHTLEVAGTLADIEEEWVKAFNWEYV
jgi:hypothetical protein